MDPLHLHNGIPFRPDSPDRRKSEKSEKKGKSRSVSFRKLVSEKEAGMISPGDVAAAAPSREELSGLLDEVFASGEALTKSPSMENVRQYRQQIQKFMALVSRDTVTVEEQQGVLNPRTLERKQYYLLREVDSKLDDLARAVLQQQRDAVSILARVEEINSLLVDLLY